MRKCPNCKKALPVGARRCVYCRMLLSDENESAANDVKNIAQFGMGSDDFGTNKSSFDESARRNEEVAHQTMIGLGTIFSDNSADASANFGQRTIAGMPGISFGALKPPEGSYRMASRPYESVEPQRASEPKRQAVMAAQAEPSAASSRDSARHASVTPAQPQNAEPQENLLAGLPGVAPMPSSLVDEEFVDLTSKIFGEDFAAVDDVDNSDDDGLDFDFTAPAPAPVQKIEPQTPVQSQNSESDVLSGEPGLADSKVTQPVSKKSKKSSPLDTPVLVLAVISLVCAGVWCALAAGSIVALNTLAIAAFINILLDILFLALRKKLSSMLTAILFFLGCLVSIVALMLSLKNPALTGGGIFAASLGAQFFAAVCSFFKKA